MIFFSNSNFSWLMYKKAIDFCIFFCLLWTCYNYLLFPEGFCCLFGVFYIDNAFYFRLLPYYTSWDSKHNVRGVMRWSLPFFPVVEGKHSVSHNSISFYYIVPWFSISLFLSSQFSISFQSCCYSGIQDAFI